MALTRKPKSGKSVEDFVAGAPDSRSGGEEYQKGVKKGNKRQISLTIDPELLRWVDETAQKYGLARAALITSCLAKVREHGYFS